MTEDKTSAVDIETARREKALLGYEMAITLWIFQGQQRWARFNIMLFVNSIILGVIGLIITGSNSQAIWLLPILAFVGLFLCGIWFFFMQRETEYARYYVRSARELEEKYLSDTVQTISRGKLFSDGNKVTIETSSEPNEFRKLAGTLFACGVCYYSGYYCFSPLIHWHHLSAFDGRLPFCLEKIAERLLSYHISE